MDGEGKGGREGRVRKENDEAEKERGGGIWRGARRGAKGGKGSGREGEPESEQEKERERVTHGSSL